MGKNERLSFDFSDVEMYSKNIFTFYVPCMHNWSIDILPLLTTYPLYSVHTANLIKEG